MSGLTAMYRKKPSAPASWLVINKRKIGRALDYGCGRGVDAAALNMESYDPYHGPEMPKGKFDTIFCTYVLCVIEPVTRSEVIEDVLGRLKPGGKAYFTVRADVRRSRKSSKGWQYRVRLDEDRVVYKNRGFIIYEYSDSCLSSRDFSVYGFAPCTRSIYRVLY
jgi:SAM-dependent methyltransferase